MDIFFDHKKYPVRKLKINVEKIEPDRPSSTSRQHQHSPNSNPTPTNNDESDLPFAESEDLQSIDMKVTALMNTLNSIQDDITKYNVRQRQKLANKQGVRVKDYFRALLMFFICIGLPMLSIEIFARNFSALN